MLFWEPFLPFFEKKMTVWVNFSIIFCSFSRKCLTLHKVYILLKALGRESGNRYIYIKRRNWTLWFWRCKNFATSNCLSKTKQRGRPLGCIVSPHWLLTIRGHLPHKGLLYTSYVGLSALLVSTDRAMRRPLHRGTSIRTGSTFFLSMSKTWI